MKIRHLVKILLFAVIFVVLFWAAQKVMTPLWHDEGWEHGKVLEGFYDEPKNSLDVIFLGSSQFMSSVIPDEIYKKTGITSYLLCTSEQEMATSYHLLVEACKYQKPKVVVLETQMFFMETSNPAFYHHALDYMKFSKNKLELIQALYKEGALEDRLSYAFPLITYHDRWKEIDDEELYATPWIAGDHDYLKGYSLLDDIRDANGYSGIEVWGDGMEDVNPFKGKYLDMIIEYCQREDIELILAKVPRRDWTEEKHNRIQKVADENDLMFIDFNEKSLYEKTEINPAKDYFDKDHLNFWGAQKLTEEMSSFLEENYSFEMKSTEIVSEWNEDVEKYEERVAVLKSRNNG